MASFPDDLLIDDERLERLVRRHWRVLLGPALWTLLYVSVTLTVGIALPEGTWGKLLLWIVGMVGGLFWVVLAVIPFLGWRATKFALTTQRVIVQSGMTSVVVREIPLSKVDDVKVTKSLLDRIFGSGTVVLSDNFLMPKVPDAIRLSRLISQLVNKIGHTKGVEVDDIEKRLNLAVQANGGKDTAG